MGGCSGNGAVLNHHNGVRKRGRASRNGKKGEQWWRRLRLPRRGKKDTLLTPSNTDTHLCATLAANLSERAAAILKAVSAPRGTRRKHLAEGVVDTGSATCTITRAKGGQLNSMGVFVNGGKHQLRPEEAAFLLDKGCIELIQTPSAALPLSLQKLWALFFSSSAPLAISLSNEEYLVYAYLRRAGFVVRRYVGPPLVGGFAPAFSAWKVGAYKRSEERDRKLRNEDQDEEHDDDDEEADESECTTLKEKEGNANGNRPAFHVIVYALEDGTPFISDVAQWHLSCGRTRCKVAAVDRGVVSFIDVAANATPLSARYSARLSPADKEKVDKVNNGDAYGLFDRQFMDAWDTPSGRRPAELSAIFETP